MYQLYGAIGSLSFPAHVLLEMSGAEYEFIELQLLDERTPEYMRLHPTGKVPLLIQRDDRSAFQEIVIFESCAISTYLADLLTKYKLSPKPTDRERGAYLQWMSFLSTGLQEQFYNSFYPERYVENAACVEDSRRSALRRIDRSCDIINSHLSESGFLAGESMKMCDLHLLILVSWYGDRDLLFDKYANIRRHFDAMLTNPVTRKVFDIYDQ